MDRVALTDDSEAWFDKEVATRFDGKKSKVRRNRMVKFYSVQRRGAGCCTHGQKHRTL